MLALVLQSKLLRLATGVFGRKLDAKLAPVDFSLFGELRGAHDVSDCSVLRDGHWTTPFVFDELRFHYTPVYATTCVLYIIRLFSLFVKLGPGMKKHPVSQVFFLLLFFVLFRSCPQSLGIAAAGGLNLEVFPSCHYAF